jgi:spore germination protein GerM
VHVRAAAIGLLLFVCAGCGYGGLGELDGGSAEDPSAQQPVANCDQRAAKPARGVVLVYLAKTDFGRRAPADRRNFVAVARPLSDADAIRPLGAALRELLEGPTPSERHLGCVSTFDNQEHLLRRVEMVDGEAVVDFDRRSFLDELGIVSASHAGAVFARQLELTAFQFPQVRSLRYELDGDCKAFGDFAQGGDCVVIRRR